jgi:hypothetical protein
MTVAIWDVVVCLACTSRVVGQPALGWDEGGRSTDPTGILAAVGFFFVQRGVFN